MTSLLAGTRDTTEFKQGSSFPTGARTLCSALGVICSMFHDTFLATRAGIDSSSRRLAGDWSTQVIATRPSPPSTTELHEVNLVPQLLISSLNDLRDEARQNLVLSAEIVETQGNDLDVGEEFKVRFVVTNRFTGSEGERPGHAHFRNVRLRLEGTAYAEPLKLDKNPMLIADHLGYGNSVGKTITFKAKAKIPAFIVNLPEPYVVARVEADFDIARFFHVVQDEVFFTQIDDG
jgi:hypothetical protein